MEITIYSREAIEKIIDCDFPKNSVVISFYDTDLRYKNSDYKPVDYKGKAKELFYIGALDIDIDILSDFNLTYDTYFTEADKLAEFIFNAYKNGYDIICQCEYGQSRSAGCAAAIKEFFYHNGIDIFVDYRFYPNQLIYHKVYDALQKFAEKI